MRLVKQGHNWSEPYNLLRTRDKKKKKSKDTQRKTQSVSRISIGTTLWKIMMASEDHERKTEAKLESYIPRKCLQSRHEHSYPCMCTRWEILLFTHKRKSLGLFFKQKEK